MSKRKPAKVIIIGPCGVGKTALVVRRQDDQFDPRSPSTIGASFSVLFVNGVKLNVWDTAGQERYRSLTPLYTRDADVVFACTQIDDAGSWAALQQILRDENVKHHIRNARVYLVFTKCDLVDCDIISGAKITNRERAGKMFNFESIYYTSAHSGEGVIDLFNAAASIVRPDPFVITDTLIGLHGGGDTLNITTAATPKSQCMSCVV